MSKPDSEIDEVVNQARPWFDRLSLPVVLVSLDNLELIYANFQCEDLVGIPDHKIVGRQLRDLFTDESNTTLRSVVDLYRFNFEVFTPVEYDLHVTRKSGRSVPVICSFSGVTAAGKQLLMVSFFDHSRGLHEKQKLAEDLKAVYHMSKLADLGKIAASVAHEMNNPLMVIQGQAELLELKASKAALGEEEMRRLIEPIYRSVERMSQIVSQMKSVARNPEAGTEKVDFGRVVNDGLLLVQQRAKFLGTKIDIELVDEAMVNVNRTQIEQVIVNLINNAMDAMEEMAQDDRQIKVKMKLSEGFSIIEIWNNGPPIPADLQESILNPFFTTKAVGKGTGLGLSVSSGILRAHRGSLKLKHSNEKGTCFELKVPMLCKGEDCTKVKALVVDDEQLVRRVIKERLEEEGFHVLLAKNGQEGLEKLVKNPDVAIVFTDLRMPVMDGMEFIRQIRSAFEDLLVVVISGFVESLNDCDAEFTIDEKLDKPFTSRQFREVLNSVQKKMDGRRKIIAA